MFIILVNGERIGQVVYPNFQIAEITLHQLEASFPLDFFTIQEL